ncbi:MAG: AAA family ATPase, partial [Oscillospiraceae bacterium]|nr:AAA family ATPase [Oscillospiraceae bacterium]
MPEDICSKCGKYPASVFTKKIKNGQIFVEGLCEKCAGKAGETSPGSPDKQTSTISKPKRHSFLDKYGISLTQKAKDGKVQKLIGREREIKQIIEVLCRMNKSNPCLIGPPGSGKTVIAEWLAKLILDKDKKIPRKLQDKEIYVLDVTTLTAGMGKFGDLEERIGFIINEVEERGNVIIFIDEIHRIVGAGVTEGNPAGGIDNMLKPALARDKFQLISATTREEYKIIEKDAALERRFQTVIIDESTVEDTIEILLGIKDRFE